MAAAVQTFPALWSQAWYYDANDTGWSVVRVPMTVRILAPLHRRSLEQAVNDLISRHPSLRTTLARSADGVVQQIHDPGPLPLTVAPLPSPLHRGRDLLAEEFAAPFAVRGGPLVRIRLLPADAGDHVLVINAHHSICDGVSSGILLRDLFELYRARRANRAPDLPRLATHLGHYGAWERNALQKTPPAFWRDQLATGHGRLRYGRRALDDDLPSMLRVRSIPTLEPKVVAGLERIARTSHATLARVLGAAIVAAVAIYADAELTVRVVTANRELSGLTDLVGNLAEGRPVRVDLTGNPPFTELAAHYSGAVADASDHPYPSPALIPLIRANPQRHSGPLYDLELNFLDTPADRGSQWPAAAELVVDGEAWVTDWQPLAHHWHDQLSLIHFLHERQPDGSVAGQLTTNALAVDDGDATRLVHRVDAVVRLLAERPDLPLAALPLAGT